MPPPHYSCPRTARDHVKFHPEDPNTRIIPRTQIDVLLYAKPKVAHLQAITASQLVPFDLEATLEDLLNLRLADGDERGDLVVALDTE